MKDELGRQLHDRATRGIWLSAEERAQLEAWYAEMDQDEAADLESEEEAPDGALPAGIEKEASRIRRRGGVSRAR